MVVRASTSASSITFGPGSRRGAKSKFDLIFVDADKRSHPNYLAWALRLARPGTVIIVDSVVRDGAIIDPARDNPEIQGVLHLLRLGGGRCNRETVGCKGWDGFAIAIVDQI